MSTVRRIAQHLSQQHSAANIITLPSRTLWTPPLNNNIPKNCIVKKIYGNNSVLYDWMLCCFCRSQMSRNGTEVITVPVRQMHTCVYMSNGTLPSLRVIYCTSGQAIKHDPRGNFCRHKSRARATVSAALCTYLVPRTGRYVVSLHSWLTCDWNPDKGAWGTKSPSGKYPFIGRLLHTVRVVRYARVPRR